MHVSNGFAFMYTSIRALLMYVWLVPMKLQNVSIIKKVRKLIVCSMQYKVCNRHHGYVSNSAGTNVCFQPHSKVNERMFEWFVSTIC